MSRRCRLSVFAVVLVVFPFALGAGVAPAVRAPEKELREEWMALYLQDQRIGYSHTRTVEKQIGGRRAVYVTSVQQQVTLLRAGTPMAIVMEHEVVEDGGGRLISFVHSMRQGPTEQLVRGEVEQGELTITTGTGSNARSFTVPAPRGLCPWAWEKVMGVKGYEPGTTYSVPVFLPQYPTQPCVAKVKVGEKEEKGIFEVTKWLHRVEVELSVLPGVPVVLWVDDGGEVWLAQATFGSFQMHERRVSKEVALQPPGQAEFLLATAIVPDRPIPAPRALKRLEVVLRRTGGTSWPLGLPSGAYQKVRKERRGLRVTVSRPRGSPNKSYRLPYGGEEWADLLKATPWLEVNDPLLVRMSKEAVAGETDALKAARRIESYVSREITAKNLSLGFATALETARQKAGDCTEHAVLVAALARERVCQAAWCAVSHTLDRPLAKPRGSSSTICGPRST